MIYSDFALNSRHQICLNFDLIQTKAIKRVVLFQHHKARNLKCPTKNYFANGYFRFPPSKLCHQRKTFSK